MIIYNKLVRDRIPEIIQELGEECLVEVLTEHDYLKELQKKGEEELKEYLAASNSKEAIEELADLLEVIYGLAQCHGFSIKELETVRQSKKDKKGAFDKRLFLVEVHKKD
ncbi:nucleoside triphosphate pyrophosphohydrolase [Priestia megaterium]|uniref:nucleoside triphosphate pyrophosphohydrolase n=1 Tax=Priestia megaterium TaxID=1404 RepID=UPI001B39EA86|nr:nucleoside triphosphate pyrophosphohydrolase [Priestia megaterium]MBQ4870160.1 nucleoside triphosphate pyrophosphohydrolase [Priestia megaterium]